MVLVVVLPCVPATASVSRPGSTYSYNHCAPEVYLRPSSSTCSTAALPRDNALPITISSQSAEILSDE